MLVFLSETALKYLLGFGAAQDKRFGIYSVFAPAAATGLPEILPVNDLAQDLELELQGGGGHATDWGRDNDSNPPRVFSPDEPFFYWGDTHSCILDRLLNFVLS